MSFLGLEKYVLNSPRTNLISANKEGIVSLTGTLWSAFAALSHLTTYFIGYMAIHLLGLATGTLLIPPSPSYFRRRQQAPPFQSSSADTDTDNDSELDDVNHKAFPKVKGQAGQQRQNDKTAIELCSYAVVWWVLMGLTRMGGGIGEGVSRRIVSIYSFHLK